MASSLADQETVVVAVAAVDEVSALSFHHWHTLVMWAAVEAVVLVAVSSLGIGRVSCQYLTCASQRLCMLLLLALIARGLLADG
jgi:hypothetical protein